MKIKWVALLLILGNYFLGFAGVVFLQQKTDTITKITITHQLISEIPPDIFTYKNLEELNIDFTTIKKISPQIGKLKKLKRLNISATSITELPKELFELGNLEELTVRGSNLTTIPTDIKKLIALRELDLHGNHIYFIPPEIKFCIYLEYLDLSSNAIDRVPTEVFGLPNLISFNCAKNKLSSLSYKDSLNYSIKDLDLSENLFLKMPKILNKLSSLETLKLSRNKISNSDFILKNLAYLTYIDLACNYLSAIPVDFTSTKIKELRIKCNYITSFEFDRKINPQIKFLDVRGNPLKQELINKITVEDSLLKPEQKYCAINSNCDCFAE